MNIIRVRTNHLVQLEWGSAILTDMRTVITRRSMHLEMKHICIDVLQFCRYGRHPVPPIVCTTWKGKVPLEQTLWGDIE